MIASILAIGVSLVPFHSHSSTPPPSRIGLVKSVGIPCNKPNTSIKFDFPTPFVPMITFSGCKSIISSDEP